MAIDIDKNHFYKTISKTCYTANIAYLFLHVFYLVLFIIAKLDILIYINAAVILLYLLFFIILKKKKYYLYALCCGNEFFAFIAVTTIMLGFDTGFHFYLIGLSVVSFFTTYFARKGGFKGSVAWVLLSIAIYLTLYFVTQFNAPYYVIDKWLEITLFVTHAILVFGFITGYLIVFIRYAISLEKKIINESRTDELTQIGNRYSLYDYFDQEDNKSSSALAIFDIDDFKKINDTYGHVTGDYILKRVAEISSKILKDDFVCRYGGEEFVIIINDKHEESLLDKLEELRTDIEKETFVFNDTKIHITITVGAIKYVEGISIEKWVDLADEKMYIGKKTGKNKVVL